MKGYIVADFFTGEDRKIIRTTAKEEGFDLTFFSRREEAEGSVEDGDFLYSCDPALLKKMPNLKWCQSPYAGTDDMISTGIFDDGTVVLTSSTGAYGPAIAEYVIMVALILMRSMRTYRKAMEKGEWIGGIPIRSVAGSTVCVAGTGDVGTCVAKAFKAMGTKTIRGFNSGGRGRDGFDSVYVLAELQEHVQDCDVLVLCLPDDPGTRGILNEKILDVLPDSAIVINVGRGSAVDQQALCSALEQDKIAGAALDVMTPEPLPIDDPLREQNNCILTPHIAGDMCLRGTVEKCRDILCENLRRYNSGRELINQIRPGMGN